MSNTISEKEQIEKATAIGFIEHYNETMSEDFRIIKYSDAPDVQCENSKGQLLALEITVTQDRAGDIQALLGRSDRYNIETVRSKVENVRRGEALPEVNMLQGNVSQMLVHTVKKKSKKDYGSNVALVIRDSSPIQWDWEMCIEELRKSIMSTPVHFRRVFGSLRLPKTE